MITVLLALTFQSKADKLAGLRTSKKIITVDKAVAPYYSIQIIALKEPPGMPSFFNAVDVAEEYACADGFVRYTVGKYNSFSEAKSYLDDVKALGYDQAFVVNTSKYEMSTSIGSEPITRKVIEIDPNKTYTIQVGALRYPLYVSDFENLDNVMEFYMKDRIYRYCVGRVPGTNAEEELAKIKALGYHDAFLVELDAYLPYKIE